MKGADHIELAVSQPLIGVDTGDVRVGIALKPADSIEAEPLGVFPAGPSVMTQILQFAQQYDAETVVVGLPRDINGNDTAQTRKAREFAGELADESGLHVILFDEFSTSERARAQLGKASRDEEKRQLDALAAAVLLDDYMRSMV
ncbi:MAG: Holliday junction resolvase RuvX [Candidatus Saccharibacteria bacterium]|jgi:putative Holliday junction resolvase